MPLASLRLVPCSSSLLLALLVWLGLPAAEAAALESSFVARITEIHIDELDTQLKPNLLIWGFFEGHGCQQGNDSCFEYYGADPVTGGYYYDFSFYLEVHLNELVLISEQFDVQDYGDTSVLNSPPNGGSDKFNLSTHSSAGVAEPWGLLDYLAPRWGINSHFGFLDIYGEALDNGGVPEDTSNFDLFGTKTFWISMVSPDGEHFEASAEIVALPEPGRTTLLAAGIAGLALLARARGHRRS